MWAVEPNPRRPSVVPSLPSYRPMTPSMTATSAARAPWASRRRIRSDAGEPGVEVAARASGGEGVVAGVDVVGADLDGGDREAARPQRGHEADGDGRLAAARPGGRQGEAGQWFAHVGLLPGRVRERIASRSRWASTASARISIMASRACAPVPGAERRLPRGSGELGDVGEEGRAEVVVLEGPVHGAEGRALAHAVKERFRGAGGRELAVVDLIAGHPRGSPRHGWPGAWCARGWKVNAAGRMPRPATRPTCDSTSSVIAAASISKPPQMPSVGRPAAWRLVTTSSRPRDRAATPGR